VTGVVLRTVLRPGGRATIVLVCAGTDVGSWTLDAGSPCDLAVVDELARLQLSARRLGCAIELRDVAADLLELLELVGLSELVAR
jgi:ABC-type transporter Mla MlaB component